jgi:hypothetical protein
MDTPSSPLATVRSFDPNYEPIGDVILTHQGLQYSNPRIENLSLMLLHPEHSDEGFLYHLLGTLRHGRARLIQEDTTSIRDVPGSPHPPLRAIITDRGEPVGAMILTPHGLRLEAAPGENGHPDPELHEILESLHNRIKRPHWSDEYFLRNLPGHLVGHLRARLVEG